MKVGDFINLIRPVIGLDPESELVLTNFKVPVDLDIDKIIISKGKVCISLVPIIETDH